MFCACCIDERGPFVKREHDGALVDLCFDCAYIEVRDDYVTTPERRLLTANRRTLLRAAKKCINGPLEDRPGKRYGVVHGPPVDGAGRCQHCVDVKRGHARAA
jgi:hypothetical protein